MGHKIRKFETQTNHLWYEADITKEQLDEYKKFEDSDGELDEPEWLWELDFDLVRDKCGADQATYELIEDKVYAWEKDLYKKKK
tara:strand:+ start:143 stop:394 length:252 start_codon:yes stop_codon:yes gene_type:complete